LAGRFEASRPQLQAVAYRMLGSRNEADDAVQEAWLRLNRTDTAEVGNLQSWLKAVVARICLDMLRTRKARREEPLVLDTPEHASSGEDEIMLADSVGQAMLVVLETLAPAERVAFVLHDMFDVPFDEIGPIVGRSSTAARQLASRARRRVQGTAEVPEAGAQRRREVVEAFLAAARGGDFGALLNVLDPEIVLRADARAVKFGALPEVRGADAVAKTFAGRAQAARLILADGLVAIVWPTPDGRPRVVFDFTIENGRVVAIDLIGNIESQADLDLQFLEAI
jgi:RNA polymerase sigma-70 factor (ECF subfamily)